MSELYGLQANKRSSGVHFVWTVISRRSFQFLQSSLSIKLLC